MLVYQLSDRLRNRKDSKRRQIILHELFELIIQNHLTMPFISHYKKKQFLYQIVTGEK